MKWLFTLLLTSLLIVPVISGINYLRKNDFKIFKHPAGEDLREDELLGSDDADNFRAAQIQAALKSFGYDPGVIDGRLGKNTREAIKEFQIAKEISPTGKIDSRTYFELLRNPRIETRREDTLNSNVPVSAKETEENKKREEPQEALYRLPSGKSENKSCSEVIRVDTEIDIKFVQSALKKLGVYHSKIDGLLGKRTRAAIKKFQMTHGLKPDGIVGRKTMPCLNKEFKGLIYN